MTTSVTIKARCSYGQEVEIEFSEAGEPERNITLMNGHLHLCLDGRSLNIKVRERDSSGPNTNEADATEQIRYKG